VSPTLASGAAYLVSSLFGGARSEVCDQLRQSGVGVVTEGFKGGLKTFAEQSFKNIKANPDQAFSHAERLASTAWEQAQAGVRLKQLWLSIAGNQPLKDHIVKRYGEPAWSQLINATQTLSKDEELVNLIHDTGVQLKEIGKESLTALVLDREGTGPNPLLLAVVQERLSGISRPVIRVLPQPESAPTPEGYLYFDHRLGAQSGASKEAR
jgi:hypothetical protein